MTNDEARMTKERPMTTARIWSFDIWASFVIRISSFVIAAAGMEAAFYKFCANRKQGGSPVARRL
jgi:hypothetical protein